MTGDRGRHPSPDQPVVGIGGPDQGRHELHAGDLLTSGPAGQVEERAQLTRRDIRAHHVRPGCGDRLEPVQDPRRVELVQHGVHHAPLPRHPVVVIGGVPGPGEPQSVVPVEGSRSRLQIAGDLGAAATDRDPLGDRQPDSPQRVDQLCEPPQVDQDVVVHRQPGHALDGLLHRLRARVPDPREQRGMLRSPGVDPVEQAAVPAGEPAREGLGGGRTRGEGHLLQVAGQPEQDRASGGGVDAHQGDAVRTGADPVRPGVAAQQQHVVPTGHRGRGALRGEDVRDQVRAGPGSVRDLEQHAREEHDQHDQQGDEPDPGPPGQQIRPGQPPRVDEEPGHHHGGHRRPDRQQSQQGGRDHHGDHRPGRDQPQQSPHDGEQERRRPDPQHGQPEPAVAHHEFGTAGDEDLAEEERESTPDAQPRR